MNEVLFFPEFFLWLFPPLSPVLSKEMSTLVPIGLHLDVTQAEASSMVVMLRFLLPCWPIVPLPRDRRLSPLTKLHLEKDELEIEKHF